MINSNAERFNKAFSTFKKSVNTIDLTSNMRIRIKNYANKSQTSLRPGFKEAYNEYFNKIKPFQRHEQGLLSFISNKAKTKGTNLSKEEKDLLLRGFKRISQR